MISPMPPALTDAEAAIIAARQALVTAWLDQWDAVALAQARWPALCKVARCAGMTDDDIRSAVHVGVCKAAQRFDPTRGTGFGTVATLWAWSALGREIDRYTGVSFARYPELS